MIRVDMIQPDDPVAAGRCDADPHCLHTPCFQVRLEASQSRQSNACAYHVADVIQALRAWAGERTLVDGQLTILAIEPAAAGVSLAVRTKRISAASPSAPSRSPRPGGNQAHLDPVAYRPD